jgi:hypothetical protein
MVRACVPEDEKVAKQIFLLMAPNDFNVRPLFFATTMAHGSSSIFFSDSSGAGEMLFIIVRCDF